MNHLKRIGHLENLKKFRQYNVILHGIKDGDTKPQETYQKAYSLMAEFQPPNIKIDQAYRLGNQVRTHRTHAQ